MSMVSAIVTGYTHIADGRRARSSPDRFQTDGVHPPRHARGDKFNSIFIEISSDMPVVCVAPCPGTYTPERTSMSALFVLSKSGQIIIIKLSQHYARQLASRIHTQTQHTKLTGKWATHTIARTPNIYQKGRTHAERAYKHTQERMHTH